MSKKNIRPTLCDKIMRAQGGDPSTMSSKNTALDDMMLKCQLEQEIARLDQELTNVTIRMRLKTYPGLEE